MYVCFTNSLSQLLHCYRKLTFLGLTLYNIASSLLDCCRELAFQISDQVKALGSGLGVQCAVVVGGMDMMTQALVLAKKPHVVVGKGCRVE